ncbi:hypothetical protein QL285_062474 [Trifolium repens]|nr:hypothetical protein QL285_062474 [Trifolium repens]
MQTTTNLNNASEASARSLWIRTHSRHLECELLLDDRLVHLPDRSQYPFDVNLDCPLYFNNQLIDFLKLPVIHLGHMFFIDVPRLHYRKVVASTCEVGQPLVVMSYKYDDPYIFECEENCWTSIPIVPNETSCGDMCIFKGRPCVTDQHGRTFMIRENSNACLLANPVVGGNVKFLVERECDLLLVDCHGIDTRVANKDVRFDVFRLDEKEKNWVKLTTLGDRVLFLDIKCSFSALASDLHVQMEIVSSILGVLINLINLECVFFTWIKVGLRACLVIPIIASYFGHLQSGSSN